MSLYLISYDLHKARDYAKLTELLTNWRSAKLLESVWLTSVNGTAEQVRDSLTATVDSDDSIVVIELKSPADWATRYGMKPGVDWLKANL